MNHYIAQDRGIKVSRDTRKLLLQIERMSILLSQELSKEPTTAELAYALGVDELEIIQAIQSTYTIHSIDEPLTHDGKEMTYHELIADEKVVDIHDYMALHQAMDQLPLQDQQLLQYRYFQDQTQMETARQLGMSQVQVSRTEQKVLRKLKDKIVA